MERPFPAGRCRACRASVGQRAAAAVRPGARHAGGRRRPGAHGGRAEGRVRGGAFAAAGVRAAVSAAYPARTYGELQLLVRDLPQGPSPCCPDAPPMAYVAPDLPAGPAAHEHLRRRLARLRSGGHLHLVTAIPAVILGHKARKEIRRTGERGDGSRSPAWCRAGSCPASWSDRVLRDARAASVPPERRARGSGVSCVCICFDRGRCDRYALTLCLGCARVLRVPSPRGGPYGGDTEICAPPRTLSSGVCGSPTHPTAWVGAPG